MGTVFQDVPPRPHAIGALTHTHTQDTHRNSTLLLLLLPPAAAFPKERQTDWQAESRESRLDGYVCARDLGERTQTYVRHACV
jgi:hypothetical protein